VDDLRNIVDRLDLLMGSATAAGPAHPGAGIDRTVTELGERVDVLEEQVEELRTLVNHLMTIATWQAKVTAQLVDDEVGDQPGEAHADDAGAGSYRDDAPTRRRADDPMPRRTSEGTPADAPPPPIERRRDERQRQQQAGRTRPTTTLDEDIDDILGVDRDPSERGSGPPNFGI
jgi:hypothetical protein